ncbi:MAG: phenylalanine--tRNA ligase subunit beta [Chloroflexota bacterium]
MKVSLKWLKQYVDVILSPADLANRLTMAGNEVKAAEIIGGSWENIVVGQITMVNRHPNADRLSLATVDLGAGQETVVCGALNLEVGDKIAFARVGARLIDGHTGEAATLKPAKIRGVVSSGMICSEKELAISDKHEGIMVLPADAPIGTALAEYLGDAIFNIEVTPNRPDCLSIIGVARETAALTGQTLRLPDVTYEETASPITEQVSVEIQAPDLCPRYCASLITGVKIGESPVWMQQRLLACGMRPISDIVDITNYVMLEYGQPLHSFDFAQIRGKKIIVRRANPEETMFTLDGVERKLSPDILVIADEKRPVAVAGVMGGANSEVEAGTTSILLEAASFNPVSIHYTSRALGLPSEASMRFERGISAELAMPALIRATQLIAELGGGKVAKGVIDVYPGRKKSEPIPLSTTEVKRVLGVEFSLDRIMATLTSLGFECKQADSAVSASPPYWRSDIRLTVDLIEEVARIIGYDAIPNTMLSQSIPRQNPESIIKLKDEVRRYITGFGFQELVTYSLVSQDVLNKLSPEDATTESVLRLMNPMTAEQEYFRPNLRPNLLSALSLNRKFEDDSIRLFEVGRVYIPRVKDLPDEREILCGVLSGPRINKWWQASEAFDFFDAKGVVESLLRQLGVDASFEPSSEGSLHTAKQAAIVTGGNKLGVVGELHPKVLAAFELTEPAYLFEIDLMKLLPFTLEHKPFQPIPRFPAVVRDLALVVSADITHRKVLDIINSFPLIVQVAIFDVYTGEPIPAGKKSLAYRIIFRSPDHTLTDSEVDSVQKQILDKLSGELGATLRS